MTLDVKLDHADARNRRHDFIKLTNIHLDAVLVSAVNQRSIEKAIQATKPDAAFKHVIPVLDYPIWARILNRGASCELRMPAPAATEGGGWCADKIVAVHVSAEQLQHDFYTATADRYHAEFVRPDDEHYRALSVVSALIDGFRYRSVLDVGAGTGRGVKHFVDHHPNLEVRGIEPVRAMIEYAERAGGITEGSILQGRGEMLPFADESFDAVCELGILHHVDKPDAIVNEMTRVAKYAVFLSDENRFARGSLSSRAAKYVLYRLGLWRIVCKLRTRGRGYVRTGGDGGVAYSYSVYDSLPALDEWADQIFLVPTVPAKAGWFHPLFGATHVLVCALRDR